MQENKSIIDYFLTKAKVTNNCDESFCPKCPLNNAATGLGCVDLELSHPDVAIKVIEAAAAIEELHKEGGTQ